MGPAAKARANPGESVLWAFFTTFHSFEAPKVAPASRVTRLVTSPMGPVILARVPGQEWDIFARVQPISPFPSHLRSIRSDQFNCAKPDAAVT